MENVFTQLMASDEIISLPQRRRGPHLQSYRRAADDFYVSLTEILRTTCAGQTCLHHQAVVERLKVRDVIISFNYDCLVDASLAQHATSYGRWDPTRSYGYPAPVGGQFWGGRQNAPNQANPIKLLKPHGSLNWQVSQAGGQTSLSLRQDPYSDSARGRIIPPMAKKEIGVQPFQSVWTAAHDALADARALIVIGYSAPDVDPLSQALIRLHTASNRDGLRSLVLADRSREVRGRLRALCKAAVLPGSTSIHEFDSFEKSCPRALITGRDLCVCLPPPSAGDELPFRGRYPIIDAV